MTNIRVVCSLMDLVIKDITMQSVVLLVLVTVVQGGRQICGTNCRLIPPDRPASPTTHSCKCLEKRAGWLPLSQKSPIDNDAIYYEPAENIIFHNRQLVHPFQLTPYVNKMEPTNIIPNWRYFHQLNNVRNTSPKTKRKNSDSDYQDDRIGNSITPIYLDINIHKSTDNNVPLYDLYQNKMRELTEKHLKDCLDLHVIIYSRKQGKKHEVDNILSERNKMYSKLPDSDLLIEINEKCNQSATIVNESMDEIKTKRPNTKKYNTYNKVKERVGQSKSSQDVFQDELKSLHTDRNQSKNFKTSVYDYDMETSPVEDSTPIIQPRTESSSEISNYVSVSAESDLNESTSDASTSTFLTDITVSSDFEVNMLNIAAANEQDSLTETGFDSLIVTKSDIKNYAEKVTETNFIEKITVEDAIQLIDHTADSLSDIQDQEQNENIVLNWEQKQHELVFVETSTINTNNVSNFQTDAYFNSTNTTNRSEYFEGEYEIPKLITAELSNETIISEIQGHEAIPNLDFISPYFALSDQKSSETTIAAAESDNSKDTLSNEQLPNEKSDNFEYNVENRTDDTSFEINGKLYFKYGMDYVPASFIQKPDGQVNVSLDLLLLCKSITKDESKLMQAICKCIKSR